MRKINDILACPPVELLDLAGVEEWLDKMSERGFHFKRWGTWCRFSVGEPKKRRYRLEPNRLRGITPTLTPAFDELKEDYHDMGWEYHSAIGRFYLFYSDNPSAPELYHDPESKALALNRLVWTEMRFALLWLFLFGITVWAFWPGKTIAGDFFYRYKPGTLLQLFVFPFLVANICRTAWFLMRIRAVLRKGGVMPKPPEWFLPFSRLVERMSMIWIIAMLAIFVSEGVYRDASITLPGILPPEPFFRLEELEEERPLNYVREPLGWVHPLEGTYIRYVPSFLSPQYIEISQEAVSQELWWDELIPDYDLHMRYSCHFVTQFWDLRWEFLASKLYVYLSGNQRTNLVSESIALDWAEEALYLHTEDNTRQILIAHTGKKVLRLQYSGVGELREHLFHFSELFQNEAA